MPFTTEQFFAVFARYNAAVWPAQLALAAAALLALVAAVRPRQRRFALAVLAALWIWMALAYHLAFFLAVNPAAALFAMLFVAGGATFAWGARVLPLDAPPPARARAIVGWCVIAYGLVGYPLVALAAGQSYPALPTFGLPCPTTIFTLGVLLVLPAAVPRRLFVVPLLWAAIASLAAFRLGVVEDLGLVVAALATLPFLVRSLPQGAPRGSARAQRHTA